MTCKRANSVGPFRQVRTCPDRGQTGDEGDGWFGLLAPPLPLLAPLKHPRCLLHHQPISLLEAETVLIRGGRSMEEHIWLNHFLIFSNEMLRIGSSRIYSIVIMNFPKLIADITMQNAFSGSTSVRGSERHPRNVCLTFPILLATNLSMLACPKLLTSQKHRASKYLRKNCARPVNHISPAWNVSDKG